MSVYKRGGVYWMRFMYRGIRHQRSTGQVTEEAALAVERQAKDLARQQAHGVAIEPPAPTPFFQDWAEIYFVDVSPRLGRPEAKAHVLAAILRFWGRRPTDAKKVYPGAPYHDLTLGAVIEDPHWIVRWETWLASTGISPQTRNHYRSALHDLYCVATSPPWRGRTGVTMNPFAGQWRDPTPGREVLLEREDLLAVIRHAAPHLKLTIAIALLAPKLRVGNVLALQWDVHVSKDCALIRVNEHKTRRQTKRPLVVYTSAQLSAILVEARRHRGTSTYVVTYRGKPIKQIRGAVAGAVKRTIAAGASHLAYGRDTEDGVTFHAIRHTAATFLAELDIAPEKRQAVMGHRDLATTMRYTHLRPRHEAGPTEQLSKYLPELQALVAPPRAGSLREKQTVKRPDLTGDSFRYTGPIVAKGNRRSHEPMRSSLRS